MKSRPGVGNVRQAIICIISPSIAVLTMVSYVLRVWELPRGVKPPGHWTPNQQWIAHLSWLGLTQQNIIRSRNLTYFYCCGKNPDSQYSKINHFTTLRTVISKVMWMIMKWDPEHILELSLMKLLMILTCYVNSLPNCKINFFPRTYYVFFGWFMGN